MIAVLGWLRRRPTPAHENTLRRALHAEGARIDKTAAPGEGGAAAEAVIYRKDTAMSHDLIEESTPRGRQLAAALALAKLIERGPDELAEWTVDNLGRLHGMVRRPGRDGQARDVIAAFGEFLRVDVQRSQGRDRHEEWIHLAVAGEYRGTQVRVWAHVDVRPVSPYGSFGGRTA